MKIQNIQQPQTFKAKNLSYTISKIPNTTKTSTTQIFSISRVDKPFIEKITNYIKDKKLPKDNLAISGKNQKEEILQTLKKALKLDVNDSEGVLIAIEDNKRISGIASYSENGDYNIDTLYMFKDKNKGTARRALLVQALKNIKKHKFFSADIDSSKLNDDTRKYYSNLGFNKDNVFNNQDLTISNTQLNEKINNIKTNINVKNSNDKTNYNLLDILGIN